MAAMVASGSAAMQDMDMIDLDIDMGMDDDAPRDDEFQLEVGESNMTST
jgi:hypothetical protein